MLGSERNQTDNSPVRRLLLISILFQSIPAICATVLLDLLRESIFATPDYMTRQTGQVFLATKITWFVYSLSPLILVLIGVLTLVLIRRALTWPSERFIFISLSASCFGVYTAVILYCFYLLDRI